MTKKVRYRKETDLRDIYAKAAQTALVYEQILYWKSIVELSRATE